MRLTTIRHRLLGWRSILAERSPATPYSEIVKPLSVDDMHGDWNLNKDEVQAELDTSLNPRSSDLLFDIVESLGLDQESRVLDIGARDARHSVTLHRRIGCRVVAVDPVRHNVEAAQELVDDFGHPDAIEVRQGSIENIPADSETFDLVFCRDVLSHVANLETALEECGRVSVPERRMLVYQTFATDLLEPAEKARLCADLAVEPASFDTTNFEVAVEASPFEMESIDVIGSEWRESWEEDGTKRTSKQLLHQTDPQRPRNPGSTGRSPLSG